MFRSTIWVYAMDEEHKILVSNFLSGNWISIHHLKDMVKAMKEQVDSPVKIYAIDQRPGLSWEFRNKGCSKDFADNFEFENTLETEGVQIDNLA